MVRFEGQMAQKDGIWEENDEQSSHLHPQVLPRGAFLSEFNQKGEEMVLHLHHSAVLGQISHVLGQILCVLGQICPIPQHPLPLKGLN